MQEDRQVGETQMCAGTAGGLPLPTSDLGPAISTRRLGWGLILFVLLLQLYSRYLPAPRAVFVGDDWSNLARSFFFMSNGEALVAGLIDPNRPLSNAAVFVAFRHFQPGSAFWSIVSLVGNSLLLLLFLQLVYGLTCRRKVAVIAGTVFALLPNLTETFHWSTQVLNEVSCALVPYALSAWLWVTYARKGGGWRLAVSTVFFCMGLFSYEAGIFLPAAYMTLLSWRKGWLSSLLRMAPFGLAVVLYAIWRGSGALGMSAMEYPPHMQTGGSLWLLGWNARQIMQWWMGDHLFGSVTNGLQTFSTLMPWVRRGLALGAPVVVFSIGWCMHRLSRDPSDRGGITPFSDPQIVIYAVAWTGATLAISLVSYTAPRLNVLPAMGISLLIALLLSRFRARAWGPWLFLPATLALLANQGTAESYRQAGAFNHRLYRHLEATRGDWAEKEIIVVDTSLLRHRLTPGLTRPVGEHQDYWASYRNAVLFRGFVVGGMIRLITGDPHPGIRVLLDVEHGARVDDGHLHWHARYDPGRPQTTPMENVFRVDPWAVAADTGRRPGSSHARLSKDEEESLP